MKIGKLKKVDIRELWIGEASDFTPWLTKEGNILQLGEAIGINLEVIKQKRNLVHSGLTFFAEILSMINMSWSPTSSIGQTITI